MFNIENSHYHRANIHFPPVIEALVEVRTGSAAGKANSWAADRMELSPSHDLWLNLSADLMYHHVVRVPA
jgi:hypothetical protein